MSLELELELERNKKAKYQNNEFQEQMIAWVGNRRWDSFVTLTFRNKVSSKVASKTLNQFFKHLGRTCLGKSKQDIKRVPVLEHTASASHYHIVLNKPENWTDEGFKREMRDCWSKLKGTGICNLVLRNNGKESSWYEEIGNTKEDIERVVGYMTKTVGDNNEALDVMGVRL